MKTQVLTLSNIEEIQNFETSIMKEKGLSPSDIIFESWKGSTTDEFLEYFLPLGWSMGIWNNLQKLQGYFLGNVLLFHRGNMQTLYLEHISFKHSKILDEIIELAYRLAKEKHLQRVMLPAEFSQIKYKNYIEKNIIIKI